MSWLTSLSETYDNFYGGEYEQTGVRIVPVGYIEKNVLFTVYLDANGRFRDAERHKNKSVRMPSSPKAAGRTGGGAIPYPLFDELRYIAGDLSELLGLSFEKYFDSYMTSLGEWCGEQDAPSVLGLLYDYLDGRTLASDLKKNGYITDKDSASKSSRENLYKGIVEFKVYDDAKHDYVSISERDDIRDSWKNRLIDSMGNQGLCYADGKMTPIIEKHQKLFGSAKLISSKCNQRTFQYNGRFCSADDACLIGYETSEKAHNTLRWLINRQGFRKFNLFFVAWSKECYDIIQPDNELDFLGLSPEIRLDTAEAYSNFISARLAGYRKRSPAYEPEKRIILMGIETATLGRASINYYEELGGSEYLERIERWYKSCSWRITVRGNDGTRYTAVSTPVLDDIAYAVFGKDTVLSAKRSGKEENSGTKQLRHFCLNMLACIYGGRRVPIGYAMTAYHRVLDPQSFRGRGGNWQRNDWIECMGTALAMLNSADIKEEYNVALNEKETDRSYLYGRLTAIADIIEAKVSRGADGGGMTNAVRLFTAMQQRPATTWQNLEMKLSPYLGKLGAPSRMWYERLIDAVFNLGDNITGSNSPLSPRFIEGYHNQRYVLINGKKEN